MYRWWIPWLLPWSGCVVAIEETVTITEPVDRIAIDVAAGDVRVRATSGPVRLISTFGGASGDTLGHSVQDGLLSVNYDCKLCGGELTVEAPPEVDLALTLGAGDLTVDDMAGAVLADVHAGSAAVHRHGPATVDVVADLGDVEVDFVVPPPALTVQLGTGDVEITLPSGAYNLDLTAGSGSVRIDGIEHDPESPSQITASVGTGSIEVHRR